MTSHSLFGCRHVVRHDHCDKSDPDRPYHDMGCPECVPCDDVGTRGPDGYPHLLKLTMNGSFPGSPDHDYVWITDKEYERIVSMFHKRWSDTTDPDDHHRGKR